MRVLLNAVHLDPSGGSEHSLAQMAGGLAERGHDLDLVYERPGRFLDTYRGICQTTTQVRLIHPERRGVGAGLSLAASMLHAPRDRPRPDLIHVNDFWEVLYGAGAGLRLRAPVVCHLRNDRPVGIENALALAHCARLIAVSRFVASRYVAAGVDERLIDVVHLGVDPARYRPPSAAERAAVRSRLGIPDEASMLLYSGRLIPEKGLEVLMEAFQRLRSSVGEIRLVIAGAAPPTGLAEDAHAARLRQQAGDWTFAPPTDEMADYYGAADLVVVPSLVEEALGRVPIEAMACGCPVVASAVGGMPESFASGLESLLVPAGDPAALAAKLEWGIRWRQHSPKLGAICRQNVERRFSLDRQLDGIETAFGSAIEEDRRRRARSRLQRLGEWTRRARPLVASARA